MKDDKVYLLHILQCIKDIEEFTAGGRTAFYQSRLIQAAVIRNLEVIGEATKHISDDLRQQYTHIPWKQMAGLRDVLIHDYMGVDLEIVWNVVDKNLPAVKEQIEEIIAR